MPFRFEVPNQNHPGREIGLSFLLAAPVAVATGSACALFLWALDGATQLRFSHPGLLWLLPVAGVLVAWLYERFGASAQGGNNLIIDAIHDARNRADEPPDEPSDAEKSADSGVLVPRRMAPLILVTTVLTHLFGGSAGREGTAVQMGGALAAAWARALRLSPSHTRVVLLCGIAAGFGGVFGTPLAGAVFALEVLTVGRIEGDALLACLFAALLGDATARVWGIHHAHYVVVAPVSAGAFDALLAAKIALAAVAFGLAARLFAAATHGLGDFFKTHFRFPLARPLVGGVLIIALTLALGTRDYLGLGVSSPDQSAVTVVSAFVPGGAGTFSWLWKLIFTAITLGSGFKGGEVTPLFFIGATLGHTLAGWLQAPIDVLAAMGFIGVFAGATNTPLACTLMGIELFGTGIAPYAALCCFLSHAWSGQSGIYLSQRLATASAQDASTSGFTLREVHLMRAPIKWPWRVKPRG